MSGKCPLCGEHPDEQPCPDEFRRFIAQLRKSAPDDYEPWLFRCGERSKAPATEFGSWKDESNRLTPSEAVDWMNQGYNIGIAGMEHDSLVPVDIDDDDATDPDDMKGTLLVRTRSRFGRHGHYFEADGEEIPNIPTEAKGEVRAQGQYVLAPGSYVPTDAGKVPEGQEEKAGYYTVEKAREPATITLAELPEVFQRKIREAEETTPDAEETANVEIPEGGGESALFDVTAEDVARREGASTDPSDRWESAFHGSKTGENMSLSNKGRIQCWRHNVAHGGLQALAALSDYPKGCADIGTGHNGSNAGPSCIKGDDAAIWHAWKFAKKNGYIPKDDPAPYRALVHVCRARELCPVTELPNGYDPEEGETIPDYAYDAALSSIREHDGLEHGREKTSEFEDKSAKATDGGATATQPQTTESIPDNDSDETFGESQTHTADGAPKLTPEAVAINAGLDEPHELAGLTDRQLAHYAWELLKNHPDKHFLATFDGQVYVYDGGVWLPEGEQHLRELGSQMLGAEYSKNVKDELIERVRSERGHRREELGSPQRTIAVENGLLHLTKRKVYPPRPEHKALNKTSVGYDPTAECPRWREFINESVESEKQDALQEYVGYCLLEDEMPFARALLLVGGGSNGKSTFLNTAAQFLGDENVTGFSLGNLAHDEYYVAEMYGALANIDADVTGGIGHGGMFKKLTGGDRKVNARRPYGEPFSFSPTTKQLYSANEVPDAKVDDDAFFRRWLLVEFPIEFSDPHLNGPDKDEELEAKLADELAGILNWAVEGVNRLLDQGRFTNEGEIYEKRERWRAWGDTVDKFISNCIDLDGDGKHKTGGVYDAYVAYCRDELDESAESQSTLTNNLKKESGVSYSSNYRFDGKKARGFKGFELTCGSVSDGGGDGDTQQSLSQAQRRQALVDTVEDLTQDDRLADVSVLLERLVNDGVPRQKAEHLLNKMIKDGDLAEPENGKVRLN